MVTENEQEWFQKFYNGSFLVKGWKARMEELLSNVPKDEKEQVRELLDALGKRIGSEWAKDNSIRRIDTNKLQQWGKDLELAGNEGPDALVKKIRELDNDADSILA